MMRTYRWLTPLALILGAALPANAALLVGPVTDPADDNTPSFYGGPKLAALDVLSANVIYNPSLNTLTFTSTMAGPISSLVGPGGTNLGTFSWGINHGFGTNSFAAIGLPNVLFDAVLAVNPNETAAYRGNQSPALSVTASGNTLTAVVLVSSLPAPGQSLADPAQWTFNLWPRSLFDANGGSLAGNAQISDFAPDTEDFFPQAVPEPGTLGSGALGAGLALLYWWRRARRG